jgi:hypothetical protein
MLHAPRGELVATWLSIMTTDARLERDPDARLERDPDARVEPDRDARAEPDREAVPAAEESAEAPSPGDAPVAPASDALSAEVLSAGVTSAGVTSAEGGRAASGTPDAVNDRLVALGLVTERSGMLRQQIQAAFCALAGSTFAAAVTGDQTVGWLIEKCEALADAHHELPDADRQAIGAALRDCRAANLRHIDLDQALQTSSWPPDTNLKAVKSLRDARELAADSWTIADIRDASSELKQAGLMLASAIQQALRPEFQLGHGEALHRENVKAVPGQQ